MRKLKNLPDGSNGELLLTGFGMGRQVFLFDKLLDIDKSRNVQRYATNFDWGYHCEQAKQLALSILLEITTKGFALQHYEEFVPLFLQSLPTGNFKAVLKMQKYLDWMENKGDLKRTTYSLVDIVVNDDLTISQFIDFPSIHIKSGIFLSDTIEYKCLKELELDAVNEYYRNATNRKDAENLQVEVSAYVRYNEINDAYYYEAGMGSITDYCGHKIEEYEL